MAKTLTLQHRQNISNALKGKIPKNIDQIKGWNKNHKYSKELREKLSKIQKDLWAQGVYTEERNKKISNTLSGENSHLWRGGITPQNQRIRGSREYRLWRKAVYERDNYTCQICKEKGVELNADHIKPFAYFPKLRFDVSNGRTLCVGCHSLTDTYKGKGRWTYGQ